MSSLLVAVRVCPDAAPCDMQRGIDGRQVLVIPVIGLDPWAGHLFVFCGRRRDRVKILYRDRDGWVLLAKRLEVGLCASPFEPSCRTEVTAGELSAPLEGIDPRGASGASAISHRCCEVRGASVEMGVPAQLSVARPGGPVTV